MPVMPHATRADYRDAFKGLFFPISKVALLGQCRDRGGVDREVDAILTHLPKQRYDSLEELQQAVRAVYLAHGAAEDALPL